MPINANIPLGVNPLQLPQQDPNQGMNALARMMQLRGMQDEQQVNALRMQDMQRTSERRNKLDSLLGGFNGKPEELGSTLLKGGFIDEAGKIEKDRRENLKVDAETAYKKVETAHKTAELAGQTMGWLRQNPTLENANAAITHLVTVGGMPREQGQQILSSLQANPAGIANFADMVFRSALATKEQLPKLQTNNIGGSTVTQQFDPVTGQQLGVASTVKNTQSPDNAATNARVAEDARLSRKQADDHFQAGQNAPQYMETDAGLVALPRKLPPGQAPTATPVLGADGQQLRKPLKDIPPAVNTAIIQNTQSLNQVDRALTLLGGKDVGDPAKGGQKGDASATGMKGYLPQGILNRVDPKGVDARAEVADIGSLKLHDRSGAAITVSESPRLVPFIPLPTDDAVTVKKKLTRLRTEIVNESNALAETYSKEQGYKPSPVKPKGTGGVTVSNW